MECVSRAPQVPEQEDGAWGVNDTIPDVNFTIKEDSLLSLTPKPDSTTKNTLMLTPRSQKSVEELQSSTIIPDIKFVTNLALLEKLGKIYSCLFDANLIPNLSAELCFVLTLLMVQDKSDLSKLSLLQSGTNTNINILLHTIHDCVYFATLVLNSQKDILAHLDYVTIKLLTNSNRLFEFHLELWLYVNELEAKGCEEEIQDQYVPSFCGPLKNVSFISEVDSKFNFPTENSFRLFSKQRDLFNNILRLWEENHALENWSFSSALGTRIRDLLTKHHEPANLVHFARLFRCQLLMSCVGFPNTEEDMIYDQSSDLLQEFVSGSPDKFLRLQERLKNQSRTATQTKPEFPGHQEFFRSFLVTANNANFLAHLKDSISNEVSALNETMFMALGADDKATFVDDVTRHNYLRCIASLRILAKFLAFVTFLPYYTNTQLTEEMVSTHLALRNRLASPPDVLDCVTKAQNSGTLILTIPWVVQYVALIDTISLRLPYFQKLIDKLFAIYSNIGPHVNTGSSVLISFCLGWLFEFNIFPSGLYFSWHSDQYTVNNKLPVTPDLRFAKSACLDSLEMINGRVLYMICPHLHEFKNILTRLLSPVNLGVRHIFSIKHLKHISKEEAEAKSAAELRLEMKEGFFRNLPDSVRKVVSFVSDNVASNCIQRLVMGRIIPQVIDNGVEERIESQQSLDKEFEDFDFEQYCVDGTLAACKREVGSFCQERTKAALPALLSADVLEKIELYCIQISSDQSVDKVSQWIKANINPKYFYTCPMLIAVKKPVKAPKKSGQKTSIRPPPGGRKVEHLESAPIPSDTIRTLRTYLRRVMTADMSLTKDDLVLALNDVYLVVKHREDLIPCAETVLHRVLIELSQNMVYHRPDLVSTSMLDNFHTLWKTEELHVSRSDLSRIFCKRNLFLLKSSTSPEESIWSAMATLLVFLATKNILKAEDVEAQLMDLVYSPSLSEKTRLLVTGCMKAVMDGYCAIVKSRKPKFRKVEDYLSFHK